MIKLSIDQLAAILLSTLLMSTGQFLWKIGLASESINLKLVTNVKIWLGGGAYIAATLIWFWLLKQLPLSLLYPFTAVSFVFGYLFSYFALKEPIQAKEIIGLLFIGIGLFLIAKQS